MAMKTWTTTHLQRFRGAPPARNASPGIVGPASVAGARASAIAPRLGGGRAVALAGIFCLLWSSAFVAGKFGLRSAPPLLFLSTRFLLAAAAMGGIAWMLGHPFPRGARQLGGIAALGLLNNTLYLGLSFSGLQTVSAGLATVIASANPLLTALLAHGVLGERLSPRKLLGLGLGLGGVLFIMRHRIQGGTDDGLGILLVGLGTTAMAAGTVLFKKARLQGSLLPVNALQLLAGGLGLLPVALLVEDTRAFHVDARFLLSQAYLALVISVVAMLVWFRLLQMTSASTASALHFLNPCIGMFLGWLILGEQVFPVDFAGILPVALGIALVTRQSPTPRRAPPQPSPEQ